MDDVMNQVSGGQLLVETLHKLGVDQLFSVSGGPINPVYDACADGPVSLRHVRHEQAAAFMAEACYRATGQAGVAVVTLGPGVTNTITPCVSAALAGVPMLIVGGQAGRAVIDKGAGMSTDTWSVMKAATKWAARVMDVNRMPEYVAEAWRRAHAPTPGPVYLEIGTDVLYDEVSAEAAEQLKDRWVRPVARAANRPDDTSLAAAREVLQKSARTLVLVGDDAFHTSDREHVAEFVEGSGAAFAPLRLARGLLSDTHSRSIGPGYIPCNTVLQRALKEADAVVLLGHHWEFDLEFGSGIGESTQVIQVDPDHGRLARNGRVDVPVNASVGGFLAAIKPALSEIAASADDAWVKELAEAWLGHRSRTSAAAGQGEGLHPVTLVEAVAEAAPQETVFVTSHGNIDFWADETLTVDGAGSYLRSGQSGTLGAEIPYGVAAALATGRPTIVFVGDGGVGYAPAELDTAARYGAKVLVVVADDELWAAIALPQGREYGRTTELGLPRRDWVAVAEGLGARARRADTADEVRHAVKELLDGEGPALLHVPIRAVESPYMTHISK
jgi:acetolactate synthase-1/2/3 large subunit